MSADVIREAGVSGDRGALEIAFRLERELRLKSVVTDEGVAVAADSAKRGSQKLPRTLKAWKSARPTGGRRSLRRRIRGLEGQVPRVDQIIS